MRRIVSVFVAAAGVGLLVGGPVAAETSLGPQARSIYQSTYRARGADALFTTEGPRGPVPGEVVTDTYVVADTGSWGSTGARIRGARAQIYQISFMVTEDDDFIWVSDAWGMATGSAVSLSVAPRLAAATLKTAVVLERCSPGEDWDAYTCTTDDQPTALVMKWTANGRAVSGTFHDHYRTRGENVIDRFQGTLRRATPTGSLGSTPLTGVVQAAITNIKTRTLFVGQLPE
jgi:hypothetical protein